jgi:hypothetical protein
LAHALQCLCDGRACCPARALQLVICRSGGFTGTVTLLFQFVIFTGMVRVGMKIPQDGNRANGYEHVAMVHEHVWRTICSVCATGARVARPVSCYSYFVVLEVSPAPSLGCFHWLFHWTGTGWCENSTRWKSCKPVWTRGHGA